MTTLRCTQKLLTAMKVAITKSELPELSTNRLGGWSLNLLHTRPKLVVAVCEHGRLKLDIRGRALFYLAATFC